MAATALVSVMACALALGGIATLATAAPDPDLLEFLGEWDDGRGGTVDWEMLDAMAPDEPRADAPPLQATPEGAEEEGDHEVP